MILFLMSGEEKEASLAKPRRRREETLFVQVLTGWNGIVEFHHRCLGLGILH
jgi:hypothetical protein